MATFRVYKNKDYTVIPNGFLKDNNLSLKAKGLLAYFLSKPDDWEFYVSEIQKNCKDGRDGITTAINELEKARYIKKEIKRCDGGKFTGGYDYSVFETPQTNDKNNEIPITENTESGKSRIGKIPNRDFPKLLNTDNKLNTDINIINNIYIYWNSKKIIVHKRLTKEIKAAINKTVKNYSVENIQQAIDVYKEILDSKFYFDYKWSLVDFLNRKNGISTFMDEGSNKANYEEWKMKGCSNGDRSSRKSTKATSENFEGNKLTEQQGIKLTDEERRRIDELE
jgi:hypothetical protein